MEINPKKTKTAQEEAREEERETAVQEQEAPVQATLPRKRKAKAHEPDTSSQDVTLKKRRKIEVKYLDGVSQRETRTWKKQVEEYTCSHQRKIQKEVKRKSGEKKERDDREEPRTVTKDTPKKESVGQKDKAKATAHHYSTLSLHLC